MRDRQQEYEQLVRRYEQAQKNLYQVQIQYNTEVARRDEHKAEFMRLGATSLEDAKAKLAAMLAQLDTDMQQISTLLSAVEGTGAPTTPRPVPSMKVSSQTLDELLRKGSQ